MMKATPVFLLALMATSTIPWSLAAPAHKPPGAPLAKAPPNNAASSQAQSAYLSRLRARLVNNWYLPDGKNNVVITATVSADGTVDGVEVTSTPKAEQAEQSASDSFSKAQPLEALPPGIRTAKLTVTYISSADPHGDSSSNILTKLEPIKEPGSAPEHK